jgi:GAF domain/FHA domain
MPAKLTLHPPHRPARFIVVKDGENLTVGRDPRCGLVIEDGRVSKQHARLAWSDGGWTLQDMGSKNGTSADGVPVSFQRLGGGEWLSFGGLMGRFERLTEEEGRALQRERLARLNTGIELRRRLSADLDPFDLLLRFLESAIGVTGADRGFVLIAAPDGQLHVEVASGFAPGSARDDRFAGSVGAVKQALETRASVIACDARRDPLLGERPSVVEQGLGVLACVPLLHDHRLLGILYVDSPRAVTGMTDLDLEILEALAEHTAIVVGGLQLERRIAELQSRPSRTSASIDELQQRIGPLSVAVPPDARPALEPPAH